MNSRRLIDALLCGTAILAAGMSCAAAQAADQTAQVRVPHLMSITASKHFEQIVHDKTSTNQVFAWQSWQVVCNNPTGAVLTLETDRVFTNTTNPTCKRDVQLRLRKNGAPYWTISRNQDETAYAGGDEVAVVSAETSRASGGAFQLRVVFVEEQFANTLAGDYDMTITGTVVAK